jgi:endoglycosylceramidase
MPERTPYLLLAALASAVLALGCGEPAPRRFITDEQGRALILHGANVSGSAKNDAGRQPWVTQADVERMAHDFGFNFARYLIFWDAIEPQPGTIDQTYLDGVAQRLDWFAAAGIHVVLDMHQDVYSRVFCCDGAPAWAIDDDGAAFTRVPVWWQNYAQPAVIAAFENFFNVRGQGSALMDHYGDAWAAVAARFKDHPAVLGYDLMNEPSPGSAFRFDTAPGGPMATFESGYLTAFYQRTIGRIRAVDPDGWIFTEPLFLIAANGGRSWVGPLVDPRAGESRLAWFPHLYSVGIELQGAYNANDNSVPDWEASRAEEFAASPQPVLIGEFGVVDTVQNGLAHIADVLAMADRATSGWAYWEYHSDAFGFLNANGSEKPKAALLVRPYARRVAGEPRQMFYHPPSASFYLVFDETGVAGPTEIYVPAARHYPGGFDFASSDAEGTWHGEWDADREVLSVWSDPSRPAHVVVVTRR